MVTFAVAHCIGLYSLDLFGCFQGSVGTHFFRWSLTSMPSMVPISWRAYLALFGDATLCGSSMGTKGKILVIPIALTRHVLVGASRILIVGVH